LFSTTPGIVIFMAVKSDLTSGSSDHFVSFPGSETLNDKENGSPVVSPIFSPNANSHNYQTSCSKNPKFALLET
jgi:hypothetical protein